VARQGVLRWSSGSIVGRLLGVGSAARAGVVATGLRSQTRTRNLADRRDSVRLAQCAVLRADSRGNGRSDLAVGVGER
jgi:hypothetical protein